MAIKIIMITFWTVFAALGFATMFNLLEHVGRQYANRNHLLGTFQQEIPLTIVISALMLLMRVMNKDIHAQDMTQYWLLVSVQMVFVIYTDLMVESIWTFLTVKVFAAISFAGTGAMTVLAWGIFVLAGLSIFWESRYTQKWSQSRPFLFAIPPMLLDAVFWGLMYVGWHPTPLTIMANYIGFTCAMVALFANSRNQRADQQIVARLTHEIQFDGLTGVRNWTMFQQDFNQAYASVKVSWPLAILAMDLDNFKGINDTYGHLTGNEVLITAATTLEKLVQSIDADYHLYRTGGEEFAVILPHTDPMTAKKIGQRCQQAIRELTITTKVGPLNLTASFGMTQALDKDRDATAVFKRADQALYRSKRAGRDRLTINQETLVG